MRLIDADEFKEDVLSGLYIYLQENKEDIARAIDDAPTINLAVPINMKKLTAEEKETLIKGFTRNGLTTFKLYDDRPQGKWVPTHDGTTNYYICNVCASAGDIQDNYCRVCGAEMGGN